MNKISAAIPSISPKRHALLLRMLEKEGIGATRRPIQPRPRGADDDPCPLSYAQQRLWFYSQMEPDSPTYNILAAVRLEGRLDVQSLGRALGEILRRHEVLRTTFKSQNGRPVQVVAPPAPFGLTLLDLSDLPAEEREARASQLASADAQRPFDLAAGPLLRTTLIRLDGERHVLVLNVHHIVFDGKSISIFFHELEVLYAAFAAGHESPLAELPIQFADYAHWQREWLTGDVLARQLDYWKRQLEGAPAVLNLPLDAPRPDVQSYRGAVRCFRLPVALSEAVKSLSRRQGSTLFMTLLATWQLQLAMCSGQDDVVVGTDIANRGRVETEELIGFFVNQLVLRTELSGDPTFLELLERVRVVTKGAYAHQDLPFEKLVRELKPRREASRPPLFQVKFMLDNDAAQPLELHGLKVSPVGAENHTSKFDLLFTVAPVGESLMGWLEYNTDIMGAPRIERMIEDFTDLLCEVVSEPEARLEAIKGRVREVALRRRREKEAELKRGRQERLRAMRPKPVRPQVV
jgi:hypothetical protein